MKYKKNIVAIGLMIALLLCRFSASSITRQDSIPKIEDTLTRKVNDSVAIAIPFVKSDSAIKKVVADTAQTEIKAGTIAKDTTKTIIKVDTTTAPAPPAEKTSVTLPVQEKKQVDTIAKPNSIAVVTTDTMRLDTIIKKSGGRMKVKIEGKNLFEILFIYPGQKITKKMSTSSIKEIRYANGRIEIIDNSPEKKPKDWVPPVSEIEYSKIAIAKDEAAVAGLAERGEIEASYIAKKMTSGNSFLEKNALIILRKKAVTLKATTILVTYKDIIREYGEYPSITMKATAYGTQNNEE